MATRTTKALKAAAAVRVRNRQEPGCRITRIHISDEVEVATRDGCLCFWVAGREVCIGPLTPVQAETLAEDLVYDAVG
jgi:hypothetical protein